MATSSISHRFTWAEEPVSLFVATLFLRLVQGPSQRLSQPVPRIREREVVLATP